MKRVIAALLSVGLLFSCATAPASASMNTQPYLCVPYIEFEDGSAIVICLPYQIGEPT